MSFHELCSGYQWLTKRVSRVLRGDASVSGRHPLSWIPAAVVRMGRLLLAPVVDSAGRIVRWDCAHALPLRVQDAPGACAAEAS